MENLSKTAALREAKRTISIFRDEGKWQVSFVDRDGFLHRECFASRGDACYSLHRRRAARALELMGISDPLPLLPTEGSHVADWIIVSNALEELRR